MVDNDLKFFTNEPDRNLYERFSNILKSYTQYFDILVGYFRTSGFFRLAEAMKDVDKIRILIGLNVDRYTVEFIEQANEEFHYEILSHKESKEAFVRTVEKEFVNSEDSHELENGVRLFIDWLKSGKLEMRMYTETPIHAKVYIMRKNMQKLPDTFGSVITGSSNFSEAGLKNNLEFNVELKDKADVVFALDRFEELWKKGVDIKETYIDTVQNKTWLKDDISPYELYLKTLYEFFNEELNSDKDALLDELLPNGYMRLQYQFDAVTQAKKILDAYGGVFISDVVGLGKTYICAMLAKNMKSKRKLIVCPPVLVDYWKRVFLEFDVAAEVRSLGKLADIVADKEFLSGIDLVFVDEAHRFRNKDTEGFKLLHLICYGKKVVLISATPINNYSKDIENQIYIFQSKHNCSIMAETKNLEGFFAKLEGKLSKIEKGTKAYIEQQKINSIEIRDKLLRHIMIRRTRKEIMEYYGDDLKKQGLSFPALGTPEKIIYALDNETDAVFTETMNTIKLLDYARYTPLLFLKERKKFASQLAAQQYIGGFMKSVLLKRLESSFYAFKKTLERFIYSYERFLNMCEKGDVYISKKVDVYDLLDNGDDTQLMELVDLDLVRHFKIDEFEPKFIPSIQKDLNALKRLKDSWDRITVDPKFEQFKFELTTNKILKGSKIIVFTESKETAYYLGKEITAFFGDRVVTFSGDSSNYLKKEIEDSFNPKYKKDSKDRYDILITTDVLAEGINLHRSDIIINYDLPWNPTKIMQRVGRINRVGTEFDRIYVFNFFPTSRSDEHLSLKDRIIQKLQAFHDTLGEDFKYLSEDEQVTSHKLYENLSQALNEDGEGTNPELAYLALLRQIRDNETDLFEKIKKIPIKAKTGKESKIIKDSATLSFIRKGYLKIFIISDGENSKILNFMDAIAMFKSDKYEKSIKINEEYYEHLLKNKQAFDNRIIEEVEVLKSGVGIKGNDAKMINLLKTLSRCKKFTDSQDEVIASMITLWENGEIPASLTKEILKDLKILNVSDELQAFYEIHDRIPEKYFQGRNKKQATTNITKQVVLSVYMKNGG